MWSLRRRSLSQNFLKDRKLVEKLVRESSIGFKDTILEIGPGKGIITELLLNRANKVIAVELDTNLYFYLKKRFSESMSKLLLVNKNFLEFKLPRYPYKVFANIPFSIEGKIIRKLLNADRPPEDAYLVVRRDLGERLIGERHENQFSVFYKPWFSFEIVHYFKRFDFEPLYTMDILLLRFTQRKSPLLEVKDKQKYIALVGQGFGGGRLLRYNLRSFLSYKEIKRLACENNFSFKDKPTKLTLSQWITLFSFVKDRGRI